MDILSGVGMALLGGVFIWSGIEHFVKFEELRKALGERLMAPGLLLVLASSGEIVSGSVLVIGIGRAYAASFLIVFTALASLLLLDFWRHSGPERQMMRSAFIINVAVIGGLLLAAGR